MATQPIRCPHCNELLLTNQQRLVYDAMRALAADGAVEIKPVQISKATGLSSAAISGILERFENTGLIDRQRARTRLVLSSE